MGEVMNRFLAAMSAHDLDAFVECFASGYRSEQPAHPGRVFDGSDQVRENWRSVFAGVPDFRAELVVSADAGAVEIVEWRWSGTHLDGSPFATCGVTVMGIEDGRVARGGCTWSRSTATTSTSTSTSTRWCARRIDHRSDRADAVSRDLTRSRPSANALAALTW